MSADNGIYVLATRRTRRETSPGRWSQSEQHCVWRVAHAQAIDNLDWYEQNELNMLGWYMYQVWGKSAIYKTLEEALIAAHKKAEDEPVLEYGVCVINMSKYRFPGDY